MTFALDMYRPPDRSTIGLLLQTEQRGLSVCRSVTIVSPAKTAEPIEIPFELWTQVGPVNHVLYGVHIGATWRMRLNRSCAAAMWPYCQIALTTGGL